MNYIYLTETENINQKVVKYRLVEDNGEPSIEVYCNNGEWRSLCWLNNKGQLVLGVFDEGELPIKLHDYTVEVIRNQTAAVPIDVN